MGLIDCISNYPTAIQVRLADVTTGISARCRFLPTVADVVEFAAPLMADRARSDDFAARIAAQRALPLPPQGQQPVRIFDKRGDEIKERDDTERLARHQRDQASMARVQHMTAYVKELGDGDALKGWQIAIERGIDAPPADWKPRLNVQEGEHRD